MNAWIDAFMQMAGIGRGGMDISLSDMLVLAPDTRWLLLIAAVAAFCLTAAWQNASADGREHQSHGTRQK